MKLKDVQYGDLIATYVNDNGTIKYEPILVKLTHENDKLYSTLLVLEYETTPSAQNKIINKLEVTFNHYIYVIREGLMVHIPS